MKPVSQDLNLVTSSRLQAIRDKQRAAQASQLGNQQGKSVHRDTTSDAMQARQLIDQALQQAFSQLPVGKQHSLFRIRYGVDLIGLKQMSLLKAMQLLGVSQHTLTNPQALADLTYNDVRM
mgnify:CR=1 FL=1